MVVAKMNIDNKQKLENIWTGLIYPPKQIENNVLNLTINTVSSINGTSALDFGGSEYKQALTKSIIPKKENDPKFGWWTLQKGDYLITFNESLENNSYYALISPHERLLQSGGYHPTFIYLTKEKHSKVTSILTVCLSKMKIKENARISNALTFTKQENIGSE
jgi:hypothetical protein